MLRASTLWCLGIVAVCCLFAAPMAQAQDGTCPNCQPACPNCRPMYSGRPDLFHNFYVPADCGQVGAQLYVSPQPVPANVGHTYVTYQPMMPHEMLYPHYHSYYRYYDGGRGMTRTATAYYYPPLRTAAGALVQQFRIPR
ncbi:MAG: hypothetical protein FJ297_12150 [Planctomycetes bacterium]|nr:hypothetical protein [Planctomycetota bacterium]